MSSKSNIGGTIPINKALIWHDAFQESSLILRLCGRAGGRVEISRAELEEPTVLGVHIGKKEATLTLDPDPAKHNVVELPPLQPLGSQKEDPVALGGSLAYSARILAVLVKRHGGTLHLVASDEEADIGHRATMGRGKDGGWWAEVELLPEPRSQGDDSK